jgi:hypothetical protein
MGYYLHIFGLSVQAASCIDNDGGGACETFLSTQFVVRLLVSTVRIQFDANS